MSILTEAAARYLLKHTQRGGWVGELLRIGVWLGRGGLCRGQCKRGWTGKVWTRVMVF